MPLGTLRPGVVVVVVVLGSVFLPFAVLAVLAQVVLLYYQGDQMHS